MSRKIIGIDLGTTKSCIAIMEGNKPILITNRDGSRTIPSVVTWRNRDLLVGYEAKKHSIINPENTIYAAKRFIGRKFRATDVRQSQVTYPFVINESGNGDIDIVIQSGKFNPVEISSIILTRIKQVAEDYLGEEITDAVITVPTCFNHNQRRKTSEAGKAAGLNVLRILNDTMAIALAYGHNKTNDEKIAIIDLGGGSLDVSIFILGGGVFELKSTRGDSYLGGDDFDKRLIDYLINEAEKRTSVITDRLILQWIREAAERAKTELSTAKETFVSLPFDNTGAPEIDPLKFKLTQAKFESLVEDLIERMAQACHAALQDAEINAKDITKAVLVGGMTRMPKIQEKIRKIFGKEPFIGMNTNEAVALGAAIQGGILTGQVNDVLPLDVMPISIGIEDPYGFMARLIDKNTIIPVKRSQIFSIPADKNGVANIHVLQGEWSAAADNVTLGRFYFPTAQAGSSKIEVTLDVDANGIIDLSARDLGAGQQHRWRLA